MLQVYITGIYHRYISRVYIKGIYYRYVRHWSFYTTTMLSTGTSRVTIFSLVLTAALS